jgi:hypothetical protein
MRKIYELDSHFPTGEATVQPVVLWGANGRPLRERFTKTASEASDYIRSVEPKPGHSIVLVLGLGAYETYDLNRNGDGFNEHPYRVGLAAPCGHPGCQSPDGWVSQADTLVNHYKSFETMGKIFRHHQNKDPAKAVGDVLKAFWNPQMHRVELLLGLKNDLAPDLAQRIADGEYPAVSMGCRIKFDVCTICGHRAPTRAQYCDHLKFGMRQVTPSGLRAGALNPAPKFFDISFVVKPADQTGYMLKKVAEEGAYAIRTAAELGEAMDTYDEKRATLRKIADIDKVIRGTPVDHKTSPLSEADARSVKQYHEAIRPAVQRMPAIDPTTLGALSKHALPEVLSTLAAAGVILTTPEFIQLLLSKYAPGVRVPEEALSAMVSLQGQVFDLFSEYPQLLDQIEASGAVTLSQNSVNPVIGEKAEKYLEKRSTISDYLTRTLVPQPLRADEPAWTEPLTLTDPGSGYQYMTTRGAARDARDQIAKGQLAKILGGGALLTGAYKVLASGLKPGFRPLAAGALGLLGTKVLKPNYGSQFMTDQGVSIPSITEMRPVQKNASELSAVGLPLLGTAGLVAALGHDYESRAQRGYAEHPDAPLATRAADALGNISANHPAVAFLGGLGLYGLAKNRFKLSEYLGEIENAGTGDTATPPTIDFDQAAVKIGALLLR